jgi:two-component system response regulator FixJ
MLKSINRNDETERLKLLMNAYRIPPASAQVTIVDDDEGVRDSLKMLLEFHGVGVLGVASAGEFFASTRTRQPDCLILDLHLPDIGGLEILKRLRARGKAPPVIVITGQGDRATRDTVMDTGAFAYLEKPFSEEKLMAALDEALCAGRAVSA